MDAATRLAVMDAKLDSGRGLELDELRWLLWQLRTAAWSFSVGPEGSARSRLLELARRVAGLEPALGDAH